MVKELFIGVDGGATKSTVCVEDDSGKMLGRASGGPANIRISVSLAWQSILQALEQILHNNGINVHTQLPMYAAMGLAGCEIEEAYRGFIKAPHPFRALRVTSDAHIACLGAHAGADGAIIVAGTGVVGFQVMDKKSTKVSGWGFPHDDVGGGAWLGLEAVKTTLQYLDGRQPPSSLANAVYDHFMRDQKRLVAWANQANSTLFAELAPLVIRAAQAQDRVAIALLERAAEALLLVRKALGPARLPCALIGGIAPFIQPYLTQSLQAELVPCQMSPDAGAVLLAKQVLHG